MTVAEIAQPRTIAERIASEGIPIADALRYAMRLAEALRGIHDTGRVYGALCPASVALTESGLELLPALPSTSAVTPYTASEVAAGGPPTARSDIFSFGAVAYEMLTGRPAFQGESPEALAESILRSNPRPSGVPSADRFLRCCLERDPCARFQHMQKVVLELKVLMVVSHCSQAETARAREAADAVLRSEIRSIESRMTACLQEQVRIAEAATSIGDRIAHLEQSLDSEKQSAAGLHDLVLDRIDASEKDLKAQGALIESTRVAVGHIEGLLEGVVEAIEALQCAVLEQQGEGSPAVR
jgi:serine/threonine protein kinase